VKWRFRNHADADEEGLIIVEVSSRAERLALDLDPVQGLDGGVEQAIGHRVVAGAVWVRDAAEFGHRGLIAHRLPRIPKKKRAAPKSRPR